MEKSQSILWTRVFIKLVSIVSIFTMTYEVYPKWPSILFLWSFIAGTMHILYYEMPSESQK